MLVFIICSSNAQVPIEENTNIIGTFRNTFQSLESSHLRQGALRDQAIELVDFDMFNGQTPSNYITRNTYYYLLKSARTLTKNIATWTAEDVLSSQDKLHNLTTCPISVLLYQYLYIKENALTDSLITYDGNHVYDKYIDGVWQNPYDTDYLFAFAPADTIFSSSVTYTFPTELYKSNYGGIFEFDAGDGKGFQKISIGSSTITANYSETGKHTLQLRLYSGSAILEARSNIITTITNAETRAPLGYVTEEISTSYDGVDVEGILWCHLRNNSSNLKPFIIIEGFDIEPIKSNGTEFKSYGYGCLTLRSTTYEMLTDNIFNSYDVFYLDLKNPEYKIEANAALMEVAIKRINSLKSESSINNIVFGSSMGGLIARYCLRNMELNGEKHETQTLICQDTPNLGANVPIGALYCAYALIDFFNQFHITLIPSINEGINILTKYLYSDSAKEMLFNFVNENGTLNNSVHNTFMNKIHQMGYPIGDDGMMRNLAISNGNDQCWPSHKPLLEASLDLDPNTLGEIIANLAGGLIGKALGALTYSYLNEILGFLPGSSNISAYILVQPQGAISTSSNYLTYFSVTYTKKVLWLINVKQHIYKYTKAMPSAFALNYDKANCSYYNPQILQLSEGSDNYLCYDGSSYNKDFINISADIKVASHIPFIPTASALDIGEWSTQLEQSDLNKKYSMDARPNAPKQTPFDAYYVTPSSQKHIMFSDSILNWLNQQLDIHIEGDIIATDKSKYHLVNIPSNANVTWSVSDESIATIDENGVLSTISHGNTKIEALYNGQKYTKYVMVEFPSYYIKIDDNSNSLCLACLPTNENSSEFRIFEPYIGIEYSGYPISFKLLDSYYRYIYKSDSGSTISVYFRPSYIRNDNSTSYGDVIGTKVCTAYPYTLSPNYFGYSQSGFNQIAITKNPYYTSELNEDQKIYYFENHGGTPLYPNGITSMTIEAENVFSETQIQSFKTSNTKSLTNDFKLRGKKGNIIQSFKVPLIR